MDPSSDVGADAGGRWCERQLVPLAEQAMSLHHSLARLMRGLVVERTTSHEVAIRRRVRVGI